MKSATPASNLKAAKIRALEVENARLHRRIVKLEVENISLTNRLKAIEKGQTGLVLTQDGLDKLSQIALAEAKRLKALKKVS